jgi:hypothetical protein
MTEDGADIEMPDFCSRLTWLMVGEGYIAFSRHEKCKSYILLMYYWDFTI